MSRDALIHQVLAVLSKAGFIVSDRCDVHPRSFDLAARRGQLLLLLKVLSNIDGLSEEIANEVKCLANRLVGYPVIIGDKMRDTFLENGAVYLRYGIPSFNVRTLYDYFVEGVPPLIYAAPGGLYVSIDVDMLREARKDRNISLGELARELGVSRRTISKYEEGMDATIQIALKLESILDVPLACPIDLLCSRSQNESQVCPDSVPMTVRDILQIFVDIGFDVLPIAHAPFNALSQEKGVVILTGISKYNDKIIKRAKLMSSISNVAQTQSVLIVEGPSKTLQINGTVLVEKEELGEINNSSDFISLVKDRKVNPDSDAESSDIQVNL
ncbi:MAG TPA: transcriptional regulator [Methanocellales archaeon]|nr:transcriptional regulator [Methanocellales archaeon]